VKDVGFFKDNKILPRRSTLRNLLLADQATLKITNQKNGRMGETITHETIQNESHGPVTALARRVHHILDNGGNEETLLCDYLDDDGNWTSVTASQMRSAVRASVKTLELHKNGIDPDLVGVHSLRAGGAMALKLQGVSDTHYQETRTLDINDVLTIHPQPNSTPLQRPINKNEHKPDVHQRR
jgi:hypothetical protein